MATNRATMTENERLLLLAVAAKAIIPPDEHERHALASARIGVAMQAVFGSIATHWDPYAEGWRRASATNNHRHERPQPGASEPIPPPRPAVHMFDHVEDVRRRIAAMPSPARAPRHGIVAWVRSALTGKLRRTA